MHCAAMLHRSFEIEIEIEIEMPFPTVRPPPRMQVRPPTRPSIAIPGPLIRTHPILR
jgi:hypothetical protein